MKNKKTITFILTFIATNFIIYLSTAFILWELNPSLWEVMDRSAMMCYGLSFGFIFALLHIYILTLNE